LWTSVAAHLTFLAVNRVILFGEARSVGWHAYLVTSDAVLLVPGHLLVATGGVRPDRTLRTRNGAKPYVSKMIQTRR
jgi:hypothetical protein